MLKDQFIKAWNKTNAPQIAFGDIKATTWDAITDLYASDALDSVLAGPDKHIKMARWVSANPNQVATRAREISSPRRDRYERLNEQIIKLTLERDLLRLP